MKSINCRGELLSFDTPKVMGILNVTPDSFFAQSRVQGTEILAKAEQMLALGATFVDIGGYSSRPNAAEVSAEEELQRVVPVVEALVKHFPEIRISVDTFRAEVARQSLEAGACIINDISAGQIDPTTGSIQIRATFPNPEHLLTNGNSGTILIPQTFDNSLVIPEVAVFEQQGKVFAYKIEDNTIKQVVVTLKSRADNLVVVESGLKAGDVIIVQGLNGVRTGDKVTPQPVSMDSIVKAIQPIF